MKECLNHTYQNISHGILFKQAPSHGETFMTIQDISHINRVC